MNIAIATTASMLAAIVSAILGIGVFTLSLGTIYLRGYLVPGTPMLTKRYFPERVLRWFDKDSTMSMDNENIEVDSERVLLDTGAIEPCREVTDLCLAADFQEVWREHIHTARPHDLGENHLADTLDVQSSEDKITVKQQDEAFVAISDSDVVGQWSSKAAFIADTAAATELSQRSPDWLELTSIQRMRVLVSLRIFIENCPE